MADRYDQLLPPAIIASIKSMPRRWADALYVPPPKNIEDYFRLDGPDSVCAAEDAGATIALVGLLAEGVKTTSWPNPEPLGADVVAAITNAGSGPWPESAAAAIDQIEALMESFAERLDRLTTSDWNRSTTLDGASVTITDLTRGAVRVAADRLARTERTIRTVS